MPGVNNALVKVVATKLSVATRCENFAHTTSDHKNGHVKCSASKIEYQDGFVVALFQSICQRGSCWLVDDPEDLKSSDGPRILCGLSLRVIEVGWYRYDGFLHICV